MVNKQGTRRANYANRGKNTNTCMVYACVFEDPYTS